MRDDIRTTHALRLGLREIKGFSEEDAKLIERHRRDGYDSVRDLWLRTGLAPATLTQLAEADAFRSLGLSRRNALWACQALRRAGDKDDLPLFALAEPRAARARAGCRASAMPPGEEVVDDYRTLRLSLRQHPIEFVRDELDRAGVIKNERLRIHPTGRRATVAGLVLIRQRPGSANGVIFLTLEDESCGRERDRLADEVRAVSSRGSWRPSASRPRSGAERAERHSRGGGRNHRRDRPACSFRRGSRRRRRFRLRITSSMGTSGSMCAQEERAASCSWRKFRHAWMKRRTSFRLRPAAPTSPPAAERCVPPIRRSSMSRNAWSKRPKFPLTLFAIGPLLAGATRRKHRCESLSAMK